MLLTIGHSTHPVDDLLRLLRDAGVEVVADVRRYPGSRRHPQFGHEALEASLASTGIGYEHLPELGGRRRVAGPGNEGWRVEAFRAYADHLRTAEFAAGRSRLRALAGRSRVAIMCAEAQWWRCHRRLIADVFVLDGWKVRHVMPDGRLVEHELPAFARRGEDGLPTYPAAGQEPLFGG